MIRKFLASCVFDSEFWTVGAATLIVAAAIAPLFVNAQDPGSCSRGPLAWAWSANRAMSWHPSI